MKTRHQFYLPADLSEQLAAIASKAGGSKTKILTDALRAWIDRKSTQGPDDRFGPKIDRLLRSAGKTQRGIDALTEMLALFVQHQLTLVAHQPPFDEDSRRLGQERTEAFLELVERRILGKGARQRLSGEDEA